MGGNKSPWKRWIDEKPKEGQAIIAILHDPLKIGKGNQMILFGGPLNYQLVEARAPWRERLEDIYWIELPE